MIGLPSLPSRLRCPFLPRPQPLAPPCPIHQQCRSGSGHPHLVVPQLLAQLRTSGTVYISTTHAHYVHTHIHTYRTLTTVHGCTHFAARTQCRHLPPHYRCHSVRNNHRAVHRAHTHKHGRSTHTAPHSITISPTRTNHSTPSPARPQAVHDPACLSVARLSAAREPTAASLLSV